MRLLDHISFDPEQDRLWLVGDLVNRGPQSTEVLRWAHGLGDRVVAVQGNHDLHVVARGIGAVPQWPRETFRDLFEAPDRDELVQWLRSRPLVHREDGWFMVHAGLHPSWSLEEAESLAREVEEALRGDLAIPLLATYRRGPTWWSEDLKGDDRLAAIIAYLTRVRCVDHLGVMAPDYSGELAGIPEGLEPWWHQRTPDAQTNIVIGHWAAIGVHTEPGLFAIDSGCVWGRELSALRLEDLATFSVPA